MYLVLIIFHCIACLILIATILLQAGKGGGLTEAFGGGDAMQSVLGTQAPTMLKKATSISAVVFLLTSLVLGMVTARRGRSLFEGVKLPAIPAEVPQQKTVTEGAAATMPEAVKPAQEVQPGAETTQPSPVGKSQ